MSYAEGRGTERWELMCQGLLASPHWCRPALLRSGDGTAACCSPDRILQWWTLGDTIRGCRVCLPSATGSSP